MRRSTAPFLLALPLLLVLAVPLLVLMARASPGSVAAELASPETRSAIRVSLLTSSGSLVAIVGLGTPLAYWLSRARARTALLVGTVVDLPIVLPPSVAGVALLLTLGRAGPVGGWLDAAGVRIAFTPAAVMLAQIFVAAPYYIRAARAGFESVSEELRECATIDGASAWSYGRHVLAPAAAPALAAGAAMSWSRAIGEFGATILFAGNLPGVTQTMPLAIYLGFETGPDRAIVLSTILILLALGILLAIRLLARRPADTAVSRPAMLRAESYTA